MKQSPQNYHQFIFVLCWPTTPDSAQIQAGQESSPEREKWIQHNCPSTKY